MIYNLNKNKSNPVENYHRKLAERKYARDKSLKTRDEEINAESDYIQNTPEFESYTPAYDVNQNITQNVAEKTEEETNKGGFWGGLGYAIEQLGLGLVRSLEGISDYVVGGVAELFGQDEWADEQMRNDWINYDHANEWYNPDGVMQFVGDVASGVGGMLPSIGAAAIPGIGPALSTGMFMTSAAGQSVSDAAKQNEGLSGNEWLYGTGSGLVEGLVEKMSGGTGKLLGKATGKMFGKQIAKSTAGKLAANFVGEGLEEVASDIIDPALRGITGVNSWEEVKRQYGDLPEQLPHTFLVGGTVGSVLGSADRAGRAIQAKGFNNLNAIENASEFKRVEGQNAQAAVKGGKVLDNTALHEKLSDNLRKMDSAQRSEFISRNGLENYFNADGGIKSASENSIVSQGYNAQAYSENIANIDKDKLKYKPTANAIRPDIAQAVKDVTLLSDGNGRYVITDGLSDGVNGFYDRESGITYLSGKADAGDVRSYVASHELVHTLEGSRQYERFANTVLKEINSSEALKNKYNIDRYIQNYSAAHDGVALETLQYIVQTEIVADFAAKEMLTDEAVLRRLINRDRNIVQRILDWVRDKIKILVFKGGDRSNIAFYKKAERQLAKALDNPTGGVSITAMDNAFKAKETSRKTAAENALAVETRYALQEALQQLGEYDETRKRHIESREGDAISRNYGDIVKFIKTAKRLPPIKRLHIGLISDTTADLVKKKTDIDIKNYDFVLASNFISHIFDSHGTQRTETPRNQRAVTYANIENIIETVIAPDDVTLANDENGTALKFIKELDGKNVALTITSTKKSTLMLKSAWIIENSEGRTPSANATASARTSKTSGRNLTTTSIREKAEKSTEKSKNIEKSIIKEKNAGEERFSIAQTDDGKRIVVIDTDQNIFDGVEAKDYPKTVRRYMLDKFQGKIFPVGTSSAFVNRNSVNEYTFPANRRQGTDNKTQKMRAGTELDNLLKVGEYIRHEADDGRHPDATRGWDYYKTWFTFDGENIYEGIISIKLIDRGDLFYDITKIENTSAAHTAGIAKGNSSVSDKGASTNNIRQENEKVNSLREKGGDERNSLKNEITTYGNGMSVTQKLGKYSEVLTKVKTDKLSYGEIAKDAWTNFQINFSDAQTGIVKAGKKLGIEDIDAKTNYVRAAYNAANSMLDENQADISGKRVGDGLKKIFSPVYKKGEEYVKEFYTYLLLKHHADRIKVDKTVLGDLTAAEALQLAVQREIKYPEFKTLAAKVWKYNDNLLQYRVDTGLITAEAAAACRKLYPHYVPTFREGGSSGIGGLSGKYNLAVKSTLKTAKGSTLDIMPIDVIMARQTMEVVRAGRINQLKNSLYDALESRQNYSDMRVAGVERVNKVTEKLRLTAPVKAELYNTLDVDYSTMRDMNNQISFYKDGNRITLDVTPEVFAGFEDFAPNTVYRDKLIEVVAKGNTMFKKLVTSANPFFLVRNFFRDLQDSLFYTKHGIRRFLPSLAKAYKQIATKGEMWNEYLAAGGLSSGLFDYNTGIKRGGTGLKSLAERALNKLEYANMFIEQAPRLAEYMLSRQKGLSVEQSLLDSADVTTNFGRGGKTAKMLNRTVMPFFNPSIQGWSKLVRTVFGKKNVSQWIQLIVRSLLLGIGLTALNDLLNGDDEDYKAVSLRDKENYYLFNIGDGQFLKLPKGRVLSVLGSLYLRGKESAKGNANAWDGYLESAASAVSPVDNFTRTIFSPLTDAATNTTWYGGVIEGRGLQNLSPENRYDESTSEIAKALGKALNYSPKKIHYIIDQYSGVIGDIVLPMTTAKSERGLIASNFTVNTAVSNRYSGEFYDKLDEITYAKNDGDRNAAFKYRYLNDIAGEVSDMYAKRREIENSDLSQQDKSAQSEAVSVLISQTQKSAVKGLDVLDEILNSIDYDKRVAKLTQGFAYRQLTDDEKEKAAVKMYDYYYALAMNKAFGAELDRKQTICNMINDDRIFIYLAHISSLTADTDSNGNTINGSRKKKVETYVDGLPLSSLHKYLLMLLAGYKLGDIGKNKVAGYFNEAALDNSIRENLLSFVA
jgi:hypothetical protein|nr:MAG TPA: Type I restriction enzyme Methylase [Caudoviricetes sp.]